MAKAKLVKRKRRFRIEGMATLLLTLAVLLFLGARIGLKSYNYNLSIEASKVEEKATTLKETVSSLENEVNKLENRERVLGMAEKDGIKTNQDQVVVMGDEDKKNNE